MDQQQIQMAKAQSLWGDGLIAISKAYEQDGIETAARVAEGLVDTLYDYDDHPVLFKPTLASGEKTFRNTKEGALSYFIGENPDYPLDTGFALKGWRSCEAVEAASYVDGSTFMWMGSVILKDRNGDTTQVDKSWVYREDSEGNLRITLHHSSLPYEP